MAAAAVALSTGVVPAKIVMKGTSRMSLNERFSVITTTTKIVQPQTVTARLPYGSDGTYDTNGLPFQGGHFRSNGVTPRNRRLAQQMESRPTVRAALRLRQKSVKQRLGAKARLGFSNRINNGNQGFPPRYGFRFRYPRQRGANQRMNRNPVDLLSNLNFFPPFRSYGYGKRFGSQQNFRRRNRGGMNVRSAGFRKSRQPQSKYNREDLDKELDEYMAKTKVQLDSELDSYMADANVV